MGECFLCGAIWGWNCGILHYSNEYIAHTNGTKEIVGRMYCDKHPELSYQAAKCDFCHDDWAVSVVVSKKNEESWICCACARRKPADYHVKAGTIYETKLSEDKK